MFHLICSGSVQRFKNKQINRESCLQSNRNNTKEKEMGKKNKEKISSLRHLIFKQRWGSIALQMLLDSSPIMPDYFLYLLELVMDKSFILVSTSFLFFQSQIHFAPLLQSAHENMHLCACF